MPFPNKSFLGYSEIVEGLRQGQLKRNVNAELFFAEEKGLDAKVYDIKGDNRSVVLMRSAVFIRQSNELTPPTLNARAYIYSDLAMAKQSIAPSLNKHFSNIQHDLNNLIANEDDYRNLEKTYHSKMIEHLGLSFVTFNFSKEEAATIDEELTEVLKSDSLSNELLLSASYYLGKYLDNNQDCFLRSRQDSIFGIHDFYVQFKNGKIFRPYNYFFSNKLKLPIERDGSILYYASYAKEWSKHPEWEWPAGL